MVRVVLSLALALAMGFLGIPTQAQADNELVQAGEGLRTGPCRIADRPWAALGWKTTAQIPIVDEFLRDPRQADYRKVHAQIQDRLISCSREVKQQQVNRDLNRNVYRTEIYLTIEDFGAMEPSGTPLDMSMTFRRDRKKRDVLWLESLTLSGDLEQGVVWQEALEAELGPALDERYVPPGTRVFGNTYGDVYSSTPTDEVKTWVWMDYTDYKGRSRSRNKTWVECNLSKKVCNFGMVAGGDIPVWSPRFAEELERQRKERRERRRKR